MNENVKTKTPKRRRWIARLLVSALCILLASSLLFVSVLAENVNTFTLETIDQSSSDSKRLFGLHYGEDGNFGVTEISFNPSNSQYIYIYKFGSSSVYRTVTISLSEYTEIGIVSSGSDWIAVAYSNSGSVLVDVFDYNGSLIETFSYSVSNFGSYDSSAEVQYLYYNGDSVFVFSWYFVSGGSTRARLNYLGSLDLESISGFARYPQFYNSEWVFFFQCKVSGSTVCGVLYTSNFEYTTNGSYVSGYSPIFCGSSFYAAGSFSSYRSLLYVEDGTYKSTTTDFKTAGDGLGSPNSVILYPVGYSSYSDSIAGFSLVSNSSSYGVVYANSSEYVPPESSDETTDTPPESSDDTSDPVDIPEGYTKIWRTSFDSDGTYSSRVIDALDLREVSYVRAFLGTFPSSESGIDSDDPIPLTLELYSGETLVDTVQYNFYAFGYSLSWMADYSFPDYVGDWIVIPLSDVTDIYFAENCPYGSVVLNSSLPVSEGGARISINFDSPDSYFTIRFLGNDLFSVYVYNDDPLGNGRQFDFGVKAYKKFSVGQYGNVITSAWYYPEESTSVTYYSSDVTEKGLYGIFFAGDSSYDTDVNMSKLEDISRDHELLESLAESIYGQYSFDSLAVGGFGDAISASDKILDSSGGSYILNYIFGMWTIHPFASAMIAIVGSLAIIGFIIRKM